MQFIKKHASLALFLILGSSFILSLLVMRNDTATFDERAHVPAAYTYVRYGDMRLNPEHPPLLKNLAGFPLLFLHPTFPVTSDLWTNGITKEWQFGTAMWSTWNIGTDFLYNSGNDAEQILFWSRLPLLLLSIFLGYFVFKATKELAGTTAGLFAALIYSFSPTIIAHNHLVTTDLGIAAFIFIATYYFVQFLKKPTPSSILLAGITLGLAELAKFSAIILVPLFGVFVIIHSVTKEQNHRVLRTLFRDLFQYLQVLLITLVLIWFGYVINTWGMPAEKTLLHANLVFAGDAAPKTFARETITALVNIPGLAPIGHYMLGVFMVFSRVTGGNSFYFMGDVSNIASKAYFPTVFVLKETLPVLLLFLFSIVTMLAYLMKSALHNRSRHIFNACSRSFQTYTMHYVMIGFIVFYMMLSIFGNLNIGLRHIFPIFPFLYTLIAATLFVSIQKCVTKKHVQYCPTIHTSNVLLGIFSFWIVVTALLAYPNYLPYYNETVGGTKNGLLYAVDSNYDWGQNLKRLKIWIDTYNACLNNQDIFKISECSALTNNKAYPTTEAIHKPRIDYYGGSEVRYYFTPGTYTEWHSNNAPEPGWYAISSTFFMENTHKVLPEGEKSYHWLQNYTPIGRAGESILIYYVSPESLQK